MPPITSPDYAALHRAILESPDDDLPRFVLCDWLEEHGEEEKAKALRRAILEKETTMEPLAHPFDGIGGTRRGFIYHLDMTAAEFLRQHKVLFEAHPITSVSLIGLSSFNSYRCVAQEDPEFQDLTSDDLVFTLPALLWNALDGRDVIEEDWRGPLHLCPIRRLSENALSRAAVKLGRKAAGLPPLV